MAGPHRDGAGIHYDVHGNGPATFNAAMGGFLARWG